MQVCKSIGVANGEGNLVEVLDLEGRRKGYREMKTNIFSRPFSSRMVLYTCF